MKGPPKPDKENPGDPIGPDFNREVMFKIFCAIVFGLAIAGIMMAIRDEANMAPECNPNQSREISRMVDSMDDRWTGDDKWTHASLILSNISGKDAHSSQKIISNLCRNGRVSHSSHKIWIDAYVETEREKRESKHHEQAYIQEFRQNIADLQNRVYELENRE